MRWLVQLPRRVLEPLMLAAGMIFGLKGDGDVHWSDSPVVEMTVEVEEAGPSGPPVP